MKQQDETILQSELIKKKLREFNLTPTIETFRTSLTIFWKLHNPGVSGKRGDCIMNQISGDLFDLGSGNWMFVGTCTGTQHFNGKVIPLTLSCSLEYNKQTDCLKWDIGEQSQTFCGISLATSKVQYKFDISGNPQVIIVREYTNFGFHYIENGCYTTFKN